MKLITNTQDLYKFLVFNNKSDQLHKEFHLDEVTELPDSIKAIISSEGEFSIKNIPEEMVLDLLVQTCKKEQSRFELDKDAKSTYSKVVMYLREDPEFLMLNQGFSFNKGLLIRGKVGCGKTLLFKGMLKLLELIRIRNRVHLESFHIVESNAIAFNYSMVGAKIFNPTSDFNNDETFCYVDGHILIDDIGAEPITSHYKSQINAVGELIQIRYNFNYITHATTNLDAKSLKEFYGERVFSRIKEMFNDITMDGNDRRI